MNPLTPIAIFIGSALLFCLQPMVGRTLLPAFGGSAAVWSVCLATFQVLLVGGYAYAHALTSMDARKQRRVHIIALALAVAWAFAIALAGLAWARANLHGGAQPALQVLLVVLLGAGVPYLVLSAGSSLLQAWAGAHARQRGRAVYRLYAVSNLGSFIGLFAYPFLLEPFVPLHLQWAGWSAALAVYLLLVAGIAARKKSSASGDQADLSDQPDRSDQSDLSDLSDQPAPKDSAAAATASHLPRPLAASAWWYVLPGLSSFMLVSTTNHLSMVVTPVPLLWAVVLGAFLLSYVVGFSRIGEHWLPVWRVLALGALIWSGYAATNEGGDGFLSSVGAGVSFVFFGGTFLHSWLYATRPESARLTRFYLGVAVGGAIGGMLVSFVAPLVFNGVWEYPLALVACAAAGLVFAVCSWRRRAIPRVFNILVALACVWACLLTWIAERGLGDGVVLRARNFYGSLRVSESDQTVFGGDARVFMLTNGGTLHGSQVQDLNEVPGPYANTPVTYYGPLAGGLSLAFNPKWRGAAGAGTPEKLDLANMTEVERPQGRPMRIAVIGLGIGSMTAWARAGDEYDFFEINPLVDKVARDRRFFTYVSDAPATVNTRLGDARLMLERERAANAPKYDVLIIDAYTGDSVPLHLATAEAFRLYADRLAPDGVLVMHISNWHLDLLPLCKAAARALGMKPVGVMTDGSDYLLTEDALWVYLTRKPVAVDAAGSGASLVDFSRVRDIRLPTDDWGSLQSLIRFDATTPLLEDASDTGGAGE